MLSKPTRLGYMTYAKAFLAAITGLLIAACATNGLRPLVLEGPELHPSLATLVLDGNTTRHVSSAVLRTNPQHSTDTEFVRAIARSGS